VKLTRLDQMTSNEYLGYVMGFAMGGVTALVSFLRQAPTFHPEGMVFQAKIIPTPSLDSPPSSHLRKLSKILQGDALVRLSNSIWKNQKEWIDVLGCSIRMTHKPADSPVPSDGDQDLIFATMRFPFTIPFAPFSTNQHDFLGNYYYAVSPFQIPGPALVKFRLRPLASHQEQKPGNRKAILFEALNSDQLNFSIDVLEMKNRSEGWKSVAELKLLQQVEMDQYKLHFFPFRTGRGIRPRGFVHYLRIGAYRLSQSARPGRSTLPRESRTVEPKVLRA
jgi:hypothetical protein